MDQSQNPAALSDDELRAQIDTLRKEEQAVSLERRLMHGRIDVVRSEILLRIDMKTATAPVDADEAASLNTLLERLKDVLTHKGPPPIDDELARLGAEGEGSDDGPVVDEVPDMTTLTDDELAALVQALVRRERQVSSRRNELHEQIDVLRTEHVARLQRRYAGTLGTE